MGSYSGRVRSLGGTEKSSLVAKRKKKKKITMVRAHSMHVPVSEKNPSGTTIRDQHLRRLPGTYLQREDIGETFKNYNRKGIAYPTSGKIPEHKMADEYDELIAVWADYFNTKLKTDPPLDPDVFKALLASISLKGPLLNLIGSQLTKRSFSNIRDF